MKRIVVVPVFQEGGEVGMKDKEERKPSHFMITRININFQEELERIMTERHPSQTSEV